MKQLLKKISGATLSLPTALCCMVLAASAAWATTSAPTAIRWLMSEPASLFDLGMVRMDMAFQQQVPSIDAGLAHMGVKPLQHSLYFDQSAYRIIFNVSAQGDLPATNERCFQGLLALRTAVNNTGMLKRLVNQGLVRQGLFNHYFYDAPEQPEFMDAALEEATFFRFDLVEQGGANRAVSCTVGAAIGSDDVVYSQIN